MPRSDDTSAATSGDSSENPSGNPSEEISDAPLPPSSLVADETGRRLYQLMEYGFWTAAAGLGLALGFAVLFYWLTDLGTLAAAGAAVGTSLAAMLSGRLVQLHGLSGTRWQEWVFVVVASAGVTGLMLVLDRVLP